MDDDEPTKETFTPPLHLGTLLVAHPALRDPNFTKTVILITAYDTEEGAMGIVLNRPLGTTLGEQSMQFAGGPLGNVPLYFGGPVSGGEVLLAAWRQLPEQQTFQLFFGISEDKATELINTDPAIEVRAFQGYSGWGESQLEGEFTQNAWLPANAAVHDLSEAIGEDFWRDLILTLRPELIFLADAPDDLSRN